MTDNRGPLRSYLSTLGLSLCLAIIPASPLLATTTEWSFASAGGYLISSPGELEFTGGAVRLKAAEPPWWTGAGQFKHRRQLRLAAGAGEVPTGTPVRYQLDHRALVLAGKAQASGNDVRLAYWDGTGWTELPRINETAWNSPDTPAELWFRTVAPLGAGDSADGYYVYYGDPALGAPASASRADVFSRAVRTWDADADWNLGTHLAGRTTAGGGDLQGTQLTLPTVVPNTPNARTYLFDGPGPASPPPPGDSGWLAAGQAEKDAASTKNGATPGNPAQYFITQKTTGHDQFDWQMFQFPLEIAKFQPINLTFTWWGYGDGSPGHDTYVYLYHQEAARWDLAQQNFVPSQASLIVSKDAPAGGYVSSSGEVWVAVGTRHSNYPPAAFSLAQPSNGWYRDRWYEGNDWRVDFSWNAASDPDQDTLTYTVTVRDAYGWSATSGPLGARTWSYDFSGRGDGTYYWKVKATDGQGGSYETPEWWLAIYSSEPVSSCPFVFVWNGREYEYVTDLAGQTLNEPLIDRHLSRMRPSAVVLNELVPDDLGRYRIKVREGLNEADYFDEAKLLLVDHPAGYEVVSSWALGGYPPKPEPLKFWTARDARLPRNAHDESGRDLLPVLGALDGRATQVPEEGLGEVILDFGRVERPEYAKLLVEGWGYPSPVDASNSGYETWLEVVDRDGSWKRVKNLSMPRGDRRTAVWDIAGVFLSDDHRLKIKGMRKAHKTVHFDRIRLDDSAPAPVRVTEVALAQAVLSHPGSMTFRDISPTNRIEARDDVVPDVPGRYFYGDFTKLGEVTELLTAGDDRFVVMRHGDAVELVFPSAPAPPEGWTRTPVLYADVWYKVLSKVVEPLPHRGMTTYPSANPNLSDPSYQEYLKTWNTRRYELPPGLFWVERWFPGAPRLDTPATAAPASGGGAVSSGTSSDPVHRSLNTDYAGASAKRYEPGAVYLSEVVPADGQLVWAEVSWLETVPQASGTSVSVQVSPDSGATWFNASNGGIVAFGLEPSPLKNRLQARVTLHSTDTAHTAKLEKLSVAYYTRRLPAAEPAVIGLGEETPYPTTRPYVQPADGTPFTALEAFRETLGAGSAGTVGYQLSPNGVDWYFWDGTWAPAAGPSDVSSAAVVHDHLATFPREGTFSFRAYLISDGRSPVSLARVSLDSALGQPVTVTAQSLAPATAPQGSQRVAIASLAVSAPAATLLTSLQLDQVGTATPGDIPAVELHQDLNANGAVDPGVDRLAAGPSPLSAGEIPGGRVSFTGLEEAVGPAPAAYLVVVSLAAAAPPGATVRFRVANESYFGVRPPDRVEDFPEFLTESLAIADRPDMVAVTAAGLAPEAMPGEADVAMERYTLTVAEDEAHVTSLRVRLVTSADPAAAVSDADLAAVRLVRDNGDAILGSGDTTLASGRFSGGEVLLPLSPALTVTSSGVSLFVVYDFAASAPEGGVAGVALERPEDVGAGADQVAGAGFPLRSTPLTLGEHPGVVAFSFRDLSPPVLLAGQAAIPMASFRAATDGGRARLRSLTLALQGTGAPGAVTARLYRDTNGDGAYRPGADTLLAEVPFSGPTAVLPVPETAQAVDAAGSGFLLLFGLDGSATPGTTYGLTLQGAAAFNLAPPDLVAPETASLAVAPVEVGLPQDGIPAAGTVTLERAALPSSPEGGIVTPLVGKATAEQVHVQVRSLLPNGQPAGDAHVSRQVPVTGGRWTTVVNWLPGRNQITVTEDGETSVAEVDLVDPAGVVYDAVTGEPLPGVTATILDQGGAVLETQITGADGRYSFLVPPGIYRMTFAAPGFAPVPDGSALVRVPPGDGRGGVPGSADGSYTDIYYGAAFTVAAQPLHFDVPLDPDGAGQIRLTKTAGRTRATVGDTVHYRVQVDNGAGFDLTDAVLEDTPPFGFRYVPGSARLDGAPLADPSGETTLTFTLPTVSAGNGVSLTYALAVAPGARRGLQTNSAVLSRPGGALALAQATAAVEVTLDPVFQLGTVWGKVFADTDGDGLQDEGEPGLPGARILAGDGSVVTTDEAGRYHLSGFRAGTAALKLDPASVGRRLVTTPNPAVVTLLPGSPAVVNFGVANSPESQPTASASPTLVMGELLFTGQGARGALQAYAERDLGRHRLRLSFDSRRAGGEGSRIADAEDREFGDSSQVDESATRTRGPLYLELDWDGGRFTWGDFPTPGVSGAAPELSGVSLALTRGGPLKDRQSAEVQAYLGSRRYAKARNEVRANDGGLYYLKHRLLVPGSVRVWLEARDAETGVVLARVDRTAGSDYDIDCALGRLLFRAPVPSAVSGGNRVGVPVAVDSPVYVMVEYQYEGDAASPDVAGGRVEAQLAKDVWGGVTVQQSLSGGRANLVKVDARAAAGPTVLAVEVGQGQAAEFPEYRSENGGLDFQEIANAAGPAGRLAVTVESRYAPAGLEMRGQYSRTGEGYTDGTHPAASEQELFSYALSSSPDDPLRLTFRSDTRLDATGLGRKTAFGLVMRQAPSSLSAEYAVYDDGSGPGSTHRGSVVTYARQFSERATARLTRKLSERESEQDAWGLGLDLRLSDRMTSSFEREASEAGHRTELRLTTEIAGGGQLTSRYAVEDSLATGRKATFTLGGSTEVNDRTRVFAERRLDVLGDQVSTGNAVTAQVTPTDRLALGVSYLQSDGGAAARRGGSVNADYCVPEAGFTASGSVSLDQGVATAAGRLSGSGRVRWAVRPDLALTGRVRAVRSGSAGPAAEPDTTEAALGAAYRPDGRSRLSLRAELAARRESDATDAGSRTERLARVVSTEAGYDLSSRLQLAGKLAWKRQSETLAGGGQAIADTALLLGRLNYHLTATVDLGAEYRTLTAGGRSVAGALLELDSALPGMPFMRLGAGYNFTSFSDDLLDEAGAGGWFVRLRGLF